jgi:hypothetical protein
MLSNLLYGPVRDERDGVIQIRSMVLELDLIGELVTRISDQLGHAELTVQSLEDMGPSETITVGDLRNAPTWKLARLSLTGGEDRCLHVDLRFGSQPAISANDSEIRPRPLELAREIANRITAEGKPRINWRRFSALLPWLGVLSIPASWIGVVVSQWPSASVLVFGTLATIMLMGSGWHLGSVVHANMIRRGRWPGHLVRPLSRQDVRAQRASRHADLKLAAVTIPSGALLGWLIPWLFTR